MLKREKYLDQIRPFYNVTNLIKVLYGLRRSGKSIILSQIVEELKLQSVDESNIIYINFESLEYDFIKDANTLYDYIKDKISDDGITYLFFDEIQKVEEFEKGINSLRITDKCSIFITGSNSRLTFKELSTDLSGRYVSFRVNPFSFKEIVEYKNINKTKYEELMFDIFEWGTLPQRFMFSESFSLETYISDVYDSIVLKDVVEYLGIKDVESFNRIFQYLLEIEGREFSAKNVQEYLKKEYKEISTQTIYNFLDALTTTFIFNKVNRIETSGKAVMKSRSKYYVSDLGVKKIRANTQQINYSSSLENIVYNELIIKGYKVYVGKTKKGEIDFVAQKNNSFKYIQVCYMLIEESTIDREFGAFEHINDNYPKYVISMDKLNMSRNGIQHVNIFDFLMDDDF